MANGSIPGETLVEFLSIDALMAQYILENPSRFAEWLARKDRDVPASRRSPTLSTDDVAEVLASQNVIARRLMRTATSPFGRF